MKKDIQSILVIVNPTSGQVKHKFPIIDQLLGIKRRKNQSLCPTDAIEMIQAFFRDTSISLTIKTAESSVHATEISKQAVHDNIDAIIVVGGDGTINAVVNGIAHSNVALGVIPFGTANVFSLEFDLPLDINLACQKVLDGHCTQIDLGRLNDNYFCCMSGIGFDAFVIQKADRYLKRIYGALSYIIVAFKEYLFYPFQPIYITVDGNPEPKKGYFVIVGNSKYYGGQMVFSPKASPTDGYLDVCIFKYKHILHTIFSILKMKFGMINHSSIEYFQAKTIQIKKSGDHNIHIDAEYACKTPATISISERALWVIC